tara:strand:+ start:1555 stop:2910 length:1356 start_codon:yes stop_codon:yes gene_type:complete
MDNVINIEPTSPKLNVTGTGDEGVIKLNITPIDTGFSTQKSVNFGPGADLLMNQGRASRQNSPKTEIKLSEINSIGLEPKKTTAQERSNMMLSGDSSIKLNIGSLDNDIKILKSPVASLNPPPTTEKINLGKSTGGEKNTETWDGYKKFNEIPVNPTVEPPRKPKLSNEEILKQKFACIRKLEALEKQGITISRKYNMDDKLEEMQGEYEMIKNDIGKRNSVKFQGKMLLAFASGIEFLNSKFDPFDINIDGWGEAVNENISEYDEVFGELHEKYGSKAKMAPELKLLFMLGGSAGMLHMTNTMFKSSMPGMDDIMKQNPDLAHQFTQAAAQSMGEQNPGFGNFMGSMMPNMQQPPPQNQPTYDNRPDINEARGSPQKSKREMKGPSDIDEILSGIKTKSKNINITNRENDASSTISITELKELQQENLNGIPGKSKRRPRSERNTLNLNI